MRKKRILQHALIGLAAAVLTALGVSAGGSAAATVAEGAVSAAPAHDSQWG
ncbi:hypothetical protein [Streptomyces sp. enrichment culture]|uniref:hypothetical protein n=1 Tax=Streptomyces sp. enrichment culture TaxID=1795815 RepID=UPI003F567323